MFSIFKKNKKQFFTNDEELQIMWQSNELNERVRVKSAFLWSQIALEPLKNER